MMFDANAVSHDSSLLRLPAVYVRLGSFETPYETSGSFPWQEEDMPLVSQE